MAFDAPEVMPISKKRPTAPKAPVATGNTAEAQASGSRYSRVSGTAPKRSIRLPARIELATEISAVMATASPRLSSDQPSRSPMARW